MKPVFFAATATLFSSPAAIIAFLIRITCVALFLTYCISWRLYVPGFRIYGLSPLLPFMARMPAFLDWTLFVLSILSLIWLGICPSRKFPAILIVMCWITWFLEDINRIQPYNLMYCYTLLIAACCQGNKEEALNALRLMVSGVYFWAGFHKLNMSFYTMLFPWFMAPLHTFGHLPYHFLDYLFGIMLIFAPVFELLIGIFLLFPAWRKLATCMALIMLVTVLFCLGPFGHNWGIVVWPWNIWLFAMELCLFFPWQEHLGISPFMFLKMHHTSMLSILIFVIAPVLCIYNPMYTMAGFKLYSANVIYGQIIFPAEENLSRVPSYITKAMKQPHTLDLIDWCVAGELENVPYPAPAPLRVGASGMCSYLDKPEKAILNIYYPPPFYSIKVRKEEEPLCR